MPTVRMEGICKRFGSSGVQANSDAGVSIEPGTIHAIVGENGAGKTTLMRILAGFETPDSGRILVGGNPVSFRSPSDARRMKIGMVHQHFLTIPEFSVAENIVFGAEPRKWRIFLDRKAAREQAAATLASLGFALDPDAPASALKAGERQQAEIARQIYLDSGLVILDEPTSVLAEQETEGLFGTLARLRAAGRAIVLITHKVREVEEVADAVTVMRAGRTIGSWRGGELSGGELSGLIMGTRAPGAKSGTPREMARGESARGHAAVPGGAAVPGCAAVLSVRGLCLRGKDHSRPLLDGVSFDVRQGEILGVCAISGNGLAELEDVLAGFARPAAGSVEIGGSPLPKRRKAPWSAGGLGYVPSDRMKRGVCEGRSISDNFAALDRPLFFPRGIMDRRKAREFAARALGSFGVAADPETPVGSLSGGTVQKAILARETWGTRPSFALLCEPTAGLDIPSAANAFAKIAEMRERGTAILLLSSDLDEILALSDRILVMYRGKIAAEFANDGTVSRAMLGGRMLGLESAP